MPHRSFGLGEAEGEGEAVVLATGAEDGDTDGATGAEDGEAVTLATGAEGVGFKVDSFGSSFDVRLRGSARLVRVGLELGSLAS